MKTFLTEPEVVAICQAAPTPRDKALLWLLWDTGARISEVLAISWDDLDIFEGRCFIRTAKVKFWRACPSCQHKSGRQAQFCPKCAASLASIEPTPEAGSARRRIVTFSLVTQGWLFTHWVYQWKAKIDSPWLFPGRRSESPLTTQAVQAMLIKAAAKTGLRGPVLDHPEYETRHKVSPHRFRDARAVAEFKKQPNLEGIRVLASKFGHKNPETTLQHYIKLIASGDV